MRILSWDIEASNLAADFGIIFCVGFKEVERGKAEVMSLADYDEVDLIKAEKKLLKDVSKRLVEADVWLTHYGKGYDLGFLNSRLLFHRLPVIPPNHPHIDTQKVSKYKLHLSSNRLITLQRFFDLEDEKNAILPMMWIRALGRDPKAMRYIVDHCKRDVLVLEGVYLIIRALITDHPRGSKGFACPVCGSDHLHSRGTVITPTRTYKRFHCQKCGHWTDERRVGKGVGKGKI